MTDTNEILRHNAVLRALDAINAAYKALIEAGRPALAMKVAAIRGQLKGGTQ